MSNVIQIKRSAVALRVPTPAQLAAGELAVNTADQKMYFGTGTNVLALARAIDVPPNTLRECTDVTLAVPVQNDLLRYNGAAWINSAASPGSFTAVVATWTLIAANKYYADFQHQLGTDAVVVSIFDNATNQMVLPDGISIVNPNTLRITISGPTRALRVTAIANGLSVGGGSSTNGTTIIQNTYINRPTAGIADRLFLAYDTRVLYRDNGTSWEVVVASAGAIRSMSYFATSVDSPNTTDFAIAAIASAIPDDLSSSLNVRQFSNVTEQGVAVILPVPLGATTVRFQVRGRAGLVPTGTPIVQHRIYTRAIPNNAAFGAWSSGTNFAAFPVPLNRWYQKIDQAFALSALGFVPGSTYQVELTRLTGVVNNLAADWLVSELTVVFE